MTLSLGKQIAHYRKKLGINQKELAARVGITPAALSQYENGKREPCLSVLTNLAQSLNTTIDGLLDLKPPSDAVTQTRDEYSLLRCFRSLNTIGQKKILDDIADLRELSKYSVARHHR